MVGLLAPGCDAEDPLPPSSTRTSPVPSAAGDDSRTKACPNEKDVAGDESLRAGSLTGDVTGDGDDDDVHVAIDAAGETRCRAFLVVEEGDGLATISVDVEGVDLSLGLPVLKELRQIDGTAGAEVVIDLVAGASTIFAGVYTYAEGELVRMTIEGSKTPTEHLFAYGGGVGQLSAVDCAGEGTVVISSAAAHGARYKVTHRSYQVSEGALVLSDTVKVPEKIAIELLPSTFPEFAGPPFASCPTT